MKNIIGTILMLSIFAVAAFADIKPPIKPPPSATPAAAAANEARMAISVSRYEDQATLVITKSMIDKINAALKAKGEKALIGGGEGAAVNMASTQTIVGGLFLSLALVFGGVWLARSKGQVSKPAVGIVAFAIVGMGANLVIGNVPPPKRVPLSDAVNEKLQGFVAAGKVKIMLVDYQTQDDISLILPKKAVTGGTDR